MSNITPVKEFDPKNFFPFWSSGMRSIFSALTFDTSISTGLISLKRTSMSWSFFAVLVGGYPQNEV